MEKICSVQTWLFDQVKTRQMIALTHLPTCLNTPRRVIDCAPIRLERYRIFQCYRVQIPLEHMQCIKNTYFMLSLAYLWVIDSFLPTQFPSSKLWEPSWMNKEYNHNGAWIEASPLAPGSMTISFA